MMLWLACGIVILVTVAACVIACNPRWIAPAWHTWLVLAVLFVVLCVGMALFGCAAPGAVQADATVTGVDASRRPVTTVTGGGVDSITAILLAASTFVASVGTTLGVYTKWIRPKRVAAECKAGVRDRRAKSNGA
jgi:hypothetical protein